MPKAPITLTTDFGLTDHYAATMKGVIASIAPGTPVIDITHGIAPYAVLEGGFTLAQAYKYFPKFTVHVAVVDPGVGTTRRPILVEAAGQYFIGPDNGIFSFLYAREKHSVRAITNEKFMLNDRSNTFHGRDIFAPCAAYLAKGAKPAQFGKLIHDATLLSNLTPVRMGKRVWTGTVLRVDHFGNLITNLDLPEFAAVLTRPFELLVGMHAVRQYCANYQQAEPGEPFVIAGSSGFLEVSLREASAARTLGCAAGTPVELMLA